MREFAYTRPERAEEAVRPAWPATALIWLAAPTWLT